MGYRLRLLFLLLIFFLSTTTYGEVPIPRLALHVNDTVGLLSSSTRTNLEAELKTLEDLKGSQVTVLIVGSTEGEAIEQFSLRVAEAWKTGRQKIDDGAILVVASKDRALRIEVGYGLEGALSDATCKQIIENYITPEFRSGNFDRGIELGVSAIIKRVSGEALPPPQNQSDVDWVFLIILAIWLLIIFYQIRYPPSGRVYTSRRNGTYWGGPIGGGWSGGGGGGFSGGGGSFGGGGASGRW